MEHHLLEEELQLLLEERSHVFSDSYDNELNIPENERIDELVEHEQCEVTEHLGAEEIQKRGVVG